MKEVVSKKSNEVIAANKIQLPRLITEAGPSAEKRYLEFFVAHIRNPGTRVAYGRAANRFFDWCAVHGFNLQSIAPIVVGAYIEELGTKLTKPTVKLHLSAIRMLFDFMVVGQVIPWNPAAPVRGPRYSVKKGKTPVLSLKETRELIGSIDTNKLIGLRDRALIGVMVYSFARVSAVIGMNFIDFYSQGEHKWLRFHEKGGKHLEVPVHPQVRRYLEEYVAAAGSESQANLPLFRAVGPNRKLSGNRLHRNDVLRIVKRRASAAEVTTRVCCHTFRATGITAYLLNDGQVEHAQRIAGHESIRSTKLYDRTANKVEVEEINRIRF